LKPLAFLEEKEAIAVLVLSLIYSICFTLISGPSGWLSETFPPETKMEGMVLSNTLTIVVNVLLANASGFLICKLKFGFFISSGVFLLIITVIISLLIPETMDVPSNEMIERVWKKHPFWRICFSSESRTIIV
jgi:hypothetical protein